MSKPVVVRMCFILFCITRDLEKIDIILISSDFSLFKTFFFDLLNNYYEMEIKYYDSSVVFLNYFNVFFQALKLIKLNHSTLNI